MKIANFIKMLLLSQLLTSCFNKTSFVESLDSWLFSNYGNPIISDYQTISTKELHFETGDKKNMLVIAGKILYLSEFGSSFIIEDSFGRLLVSAVNESISSLLEENIVGKEVKILGYSERGKKGLPLLRAISMSFEADKTPL